MTETAVKDRLDLQTVGEAPAAQLPTVAQPERPPAVRREPKAFPGSIAKAIIAIQREIGAIQKAGYNEFQRYRYTRWEDICEKLSPLLAEHGLVIQQSEKSRNLLEENDKGSVLAIVYEFTLINEHGDQWPPVEWTAIARLRDQKGVTDDKAASKCHTQAEKQFCVKQFKIRTEEFEEGKNVNTLPKKDARESFKKLQQEIDDARSVVELETWGKNNIGRLHEQPPDWQDQLRSRYREKLTELKGNSEQEVWDDETGEITPEGAGDAAASDPHDTPSEAAVLSHQLAKWDENLGDAAKISSTVLTSMWSNVPPDLKPHLKSAYDRRHRPTAKEADQARQKA